MRQTRIWSLASIGLLLAGLGGFAAVAGHAAGFNGGAGGTTPHPDYDPDTILVEFKQQAPNLARVGSAQRAGLRVVQQSSSAYATLKVPALPGKPTAASRDAYLQAKLKELRNDPNVEAAEPDYYRYPQQLQEYQPNDPFFENQWHHRNLGPFSVPTPYGKYDADIDSVEGWISPGFVGARASDFGNQSVIVAVIDTGVDYTHNDFRSTAPAYSNIYNNPADPAGDANGDTIADDDGNGLVDDFRGWDFANGDNDPQDDLQGHGTSVAGCIAAVGDNQTGLAGMCWDAKIMPLKVFKTDEAFMPRTAASVSRIVQAIDYAISHNAKIIVCAFTGSTFSSIERSALTRARNRGLLVVCAAGNGNIGSGAAGINLNPSAGTNRAFPASYASDPGTPSPGFNSVLDNLIVVGSTSRYDTLSRFSNFGADAVDIAAPGEDIWTLWPGQRYDGVAGTSMSAGIVAGAAALVWSRFDTLTYGGVKQRLLTTAERLPALNGQVKTGRLNLDLALGDDTTAPGDPTSLTAIRNNSTCIQLSWVASGDDGILGTAARYDLRYQLASSGPDFASATPAVIPTQPSNAPAPTASGTVQTYLLQALAPGTQYYVFIQAFDKADNPSNVVQAGPFTTTAVPQYSIAWIDTLNDPYPLVPNVPAAGPFFSQFTNGAGVTTFDRAGQDPGLHSAPRVYSDSPNTAAAPGTQVNYGNNQDRIIAMDSTVLIPAQFPNPILAFSYTLELGAGDTLDPEISVDNGATWRAIPGGQFRPNNNSTTWVTPFTGGGNKLPAFPLTAVIGGNTTVVEQDIKIRFRLHADNVASTENNGVHIDDVMIVGEPLLNLGSAPAAPVVLPSDNPAVSQATSATTVSFSFLDQSNNEDGFIITRRTGAGAFAEIGRITSTTVTGTGTMYTYPDSGLAANTTYTYQVTAYNTFGTTASLQTYTVRTAAPTNAPSNLQAKADPGNPAQNILLTWTDNNGSSPTPETGYKVERRSEDEIVFTEIANNVPVNTTSYIDTNGGAGLVAGKLYYYRVRTFNLVGNSGYSGTASARVGPPKTPTNLIGTPLSATQIRLNWTDNSNDETGFTLERSLVSDFSVIDRTISPAANATQSTDGVGLVVDNTYYYRIRANGPGGSSSYAESNVATVPFFRAVAPSGLTATKLSSTQIRLDWNDNSSDETQFEIEQQTDPLAFTGNPNVTNPGPNPTATATATRTGLNPGTTYYYRIRSRNVVGASAWVPAAADPQVSATTDVAPPANPSNFTATLLDATTIRLRWTDNSTDETGFTVEQNVGGNITLLPYGANDQTVNPLVVHDVTVTAGNTYVFRVRAEKVGGVSSWIGPVSVDVLVPSAPINLTATPLSGTQIRLNWTDNSNNETGFKIERSTDNFATVTSSVTTTAAGVVTYTDNNGGAGLTPGTLYFYRVRAVNLVGESANATVSATTLVIPAAPSNLQATPVSGTQIRLTWTDNSSNEEGFQIERVTGANFATGSNKTAILVTANSISYNEPLGSLAAGVTYTYRIRAYNAAGNSAFSSEATATTIGSPAAPTGLTATVSGTTITLQWNDVSNNETGYLVERKLNSGAFQLIKTLGANVNGYTDTNLGVGNTYTYQVRAYNGVGNSAYSNQAGGTITSGSALPAPSNLTATALGGLRALITWTDNSTTESGFRIERQTGTGAFVEIAVVGADQTSYVDSRLQAGVSYTYRVRAYSGFKVTTYTNTASITAIR